MFVPWLKLPACAIHLACTFVYQLKTGDRWTIQGLLWGMQGRCGCVFVLACRACAG
jgi:hypothetical protein